MRNPSSRPIRALALPLLLAGPLSACAISDEPAFSDGGDRESDGPGLLDGESAQGDPGGGGGGTPGGGGGQDEDGGAVESEGEGDDGAPAGPDADVALCADQTPVEATGVVVACGDDTGELAYRFDGLAITDPPELAGILGGLIHQDIQQGKLHILIEARGLVGGDGAAFQVVGGGGGACEGMAGAYTWDTVTQGSQPSAPFDSAVDAEGHFESGDDSSVLYFPIILLNASVRLDRLRVSGTLDADRNAITEGVLEGYITRGTADGTCLPPPFNTPLTSALPEAAESIADCGGEDCWLLAGTFTATKVALHAAAAPPAQ